MVYEENLILNNKNNHDPLPPDKFFKTICHIPLTHQLASLTFGSLCSLVTSPTRGEVKHKYWLLGPLPLWGRPTEALAGGR